MSDVSGQDRLKVASRHCRGQSLAYLDEHDMALEIFMVAPVALYALRPRFTSPSYTTATG